MAPGSQEQELQRNIEVLLSPNASGYLASFC
jgi:hypothetical protein